jgi:hypothetical protein
MKRRKKTTLGKKVPARAPSAAPRRSAPEASAKVADGFARVVAAFAADPALAEVADQYANRALVPSRGFGSRGLKVNGKLFALVSSKGEFVVKLPKDRVAALTDGGAGHPFDPGRGRLMKEWLAVTSPRASWIDLAKEAYAFVRGSRGKR